MSSDKKKSETADVSEQHIPIDFNTFILSLGSSAIYHMGIAPHPESHNTCTNLPMAQQTIDILNLLKQKTSGNLQGEEERLLEQLIDDLNKKYLSVIKACGC
jgi:hypothetical protein